MSTYLTAYEEELTRIIESGGTQDVVDKAVDEYNRFQKSAFEVWLKGASLKCIHCGADAEQEGVEPVEEIACKEHRHK